MEVAKDQVVTTAAAAAAAGGGRSSSSSSRCSRRIPGGGGALLSCACIARIRPRGRCLWQLAARCAVALSVQGRRRDERGGRIGGEERGGVREGVAGAVDSLGRW